MDELHWFKYQVRTSGICSFYDLQVKIAVKLKWFDWLNSSFKKNPKPMDWYSYRSRGAGAVLTRFSQPRVSPVLPAAPLGPSAKLGLWGAPRQTWVVLKPGERTSIF